MSKKSSHRLTNAERAERRRQDRERLQRAAEELLSSDGWARWVKTRAMFHSYSAGNCMLLVSVQSSGPGAGIPCRCSESCRYGARRGGGGV
jgi:hypothetical protein